MRNFIQRLRTRSHLHDNVVGLLAEFTDPGALVQAVHGVRNRGFKQYDTYTPFPIHGMDRAMGLGPSKLGFLVFGGGVTGMLLGLWVQWWMNAVDYPINISGKPFFAIESAIPITFELTILFAALAAVGGMLAINGLPRPYNPLFYSDRFARATDDGFFLFIESSDALFDLEGTEQFLRDQGAIFVEIIAEPLET